MNKKYLIAVSGGPDSMYLLNKYKDKDVVVATVNYNQRHDSGVDFNIVKDFCKLYNIKFEGLNLNKPDYTGGNFQNW
ncbi:tRNA(Ile)-lysidine synthase, partial [Mycoplasmopsis edwardii]